MFEFLIGLCAEEAEKNKEAKRARRFGSDKSTYELEIINYEKNLGGVPISIADKTNFYIAWVIKAIVTFDPPLGTPRAGPNKVLMITNLDEKRQSWGEEEDAELIINRGIINGRYAWTAENIDQIRYAWTAAMLLGSILPHKFDHQLIHVPDIFNAKAEMGWFTRFGSASLYETKFKQHINEDAIKRFLTDSSITIVDRKKFDALVQLFRYFPAQVTELDLSSQQLDSIGAPRLAEALTSIPSHINVLRLRDTGLSYLAGSELALIFAAIPPNVTFLDISDNHLQYKKVSRIPHSRSTPNRLTSIFFHERRFDLALAFSGLRRNITTLILDNNHFDDRFLPLTEIFRIIPTSITQFSLEARLENVEVARKKDQEATELARKKNKEAAELALKRKKDAEVAEKIRLKKEKEKEEADRVLRLSRSLHNLFKPNEFGMMSATPMLIQELLKQGANIDYQEERNANTVLTLAANCQNDQLTEYLLKQGANPLLRNKNSEKASDLVVSSSPIYQFLKDRELRFVASAGNLPVKSGSLATGTDITSKAAHDSTRLTMYVNKARLLESKKYKVAAAEKVKEQAEKVKEQREADRVLRLNGSLHDLFKPNEFGMLSAKPLGIDALLKQGADINYQEEQNANTALILAANDQNDQLIEYLLKKGANPLLKNKSGEMASDLVVDRSPIHHLLKNWELRFAASTDNLRAAKFAYRTGADINFQGTDGSTAVMIAVTKESEEMVSFLLSNYVDLSLQNDEGKVARDLANPRMKHLLIPAAGQTESDAASTAPESDGANGYGFFSRVFDEEEEKPATTKSSKAPTLD